jgi:hypothetical protein
MGEIMPTQADLAWQALQQAAPSDAVAPAGTQADQAWEALKNAPDTKPAEPTVWEKYGGELGRQTGLFARDAVTGITGLPAIVGNALNGAINLGTTGINELTGTKIPQLAMPSQVIQDAENKAGFPQPKNTLENITNAGASAMAGVSPTLAAGNWFLKSADPVASALGRALTVAPVNQLAAASTGAEAAQGAKEAGLGPGWQMGAALAGGGLGAVGSSGLGSFMKMTGRNLAPTATESVAPGAIPQYTANAEGGTNTVNSQSPFGISPDKAAEMMDSTDNFLRNNPGADPTAAARSAEFRSLGMQPTLGQITRDPGLFADEQNLRGLTVGAPLLQRFSTQNQQLANMLDSYASNQTPYQAGNVIKPALQNIDKTMKAGVSDAYKQAAQSSGKALNVPLQGVAQDYADVLHNFGDKVPSGVQNNFNSLGLNTGMQNKVFSVEDAENLLKNINSNKGIDPATNLALGKLSDSVKNAVLSADDQGGVFAPARALAAQRFALHDQVPALADAVYGNTTPENFANKYVINGGVDDVKNLTNLIKTTSPDAMQAIQGQVGNKLNASAFGTNAAGDRVFSPNAYATALNKTMGPDLLKSVYSPDKLDDLNTIGRVGSYINSPPAYSPVNFSNTGSAAMKMLQEIPYIGKGLQSFQKSSLVARSLNGNLGDTVGNMTAQPNGGAIPVNLNNSAMAQAYAQLLKQKQDSN